MPVNRKNRKVENGNTNSQPPQLKSWFFTFNNYTSDDILSLERCFNTLCIKYVFQEETGASGTPHLQGSIHLKKAMRPTEFQLSNKIHWEKTKNCLAADSYACKAETRTGKIYSKGLPKPLLLITELYPWQKNILDLINQEPDQRKVYWFWEDNGNIGKSAFTKYLVFHHKALFCTGGKYSDIMNLIFNNNMDECNLIIFDIPRNHGGKISYDSLESIKNGLVCNTKYETGVKIFNSPHIIVFANAPPDNPELLSSDRWVIKYLQ